MWVRIDELAFAVDRDEEVTDDVRNRAVTRHAGEGYRGFRLLVDAPAGRALDVSYWDSWAGAMGGEADHCAEAAGAAGTFSTVRSNVYEMRIDAV